MPRQYGQVGAITQLAHPNLKLFPTRDVCGFSRTFNITTTTSTTEGPEFRRRKRVIGGRLALQGELPGIAQFMTRDPTEQTNDGYYAGGSGILINSRYVLTTASLIRRKFVGGYVMDAVGFRSSSLSDELYAIRIEKMIMHEEFGPNNRVNDIALIRLKIPVDFELETNPICLPLDKIGSRKHVEWEVEQSTCATSNLVGAGWGRTAATVSSIPHFANYIEMKLRPKAHCDRAYSSQVGKLDSGRLCVSSCLGEQTGLCGVNDMGSPLMDYKMTSNGEKQYTLVGLASNFAECGIQSLPTIYTNIEHHLPWILDHIKP